MSTKPSRTADVPKRTRTVFTLRFNEVGLVLAALFFSFSLFPSLLPRGAMFQGLASAVLALAGYALGVAINWLWNFLGIPPMTGRVKMTAVWVSRVVVGFTFLSAIWQHVGWQNDVREVFGMPAVTPTRWIMVTLYTVAIAAVLLVIGRSILKGTKALARWLDKRLPERVAVVVGVGVVALALWLFATGALVNGFFAVANVMFSSRDTNTPADIEQPTSTQRSGGPESLVDWDSLGRQGRKFTGGGPTIDDLNAFSGGEAIQPIRVYAGIKSAETIEERASLVLDELIRTDAFDREVLIVGTTTGTGFLDEDAVDPLEYIYNGDSAIVGVQYSYLPSWISLLADQEVTKQTSQIVFTTIHDYWTELPEDDRPELYLYGLSLGSFGVESVLQAIDIINEPIDGAFLAGPPFVNPLHAEILKSREPGTPEWQPIYSDGRTVRFTSQVSGFDEPDGPWGPTRMAYLQHGSDPVVFFSTDIALNAPDWLSITEQRPPDVSEEMVWVPLVTMVQVLMDLPAAGTTPEGFAHLYSMTENAVGWIGVTQPQGWTDADTDRLMPFLQAIMDEKAADGS